MRTYNEWLVAGHAVLQGERAEHYRVNEDRTAGFALFRPDQTVPIAIRDEETRCHEVITAEDWREAKKARRRVAHPLAKVREDPDGFWIWCGNNKKVIEHLKANGWKFHSASRRWHGKLDVDLSVVTAALEALGCRTEVE